MPLRCYLRGALYVPREAMTEEEIKADWLALSERNPARVAADRAGDPRAWAHPERVSSLEITPTEIIYPIATPNVYRPRLRGLALDVVDERPRFDAKPLPFNGRTLLPFQERMIDSLLARSYGIAVSPCGSGKGELLVAAIARIGLPTIVLVGQIDLAEDLRTRFEERTGERAGMIGGGAFDVRRVTFALVQSLDTARLAEIADLFEVVIVDEVHHAAAETYRRVLGALRVRRRYGLTATAFREDGLWSFVEHHVGPIVARVTQSELAAAGRSLLPTREEVITGWTYGPGYSSRDDYGPMISAMAECTQRRQVILERVVAEHAPGVLQAVLVGRVAVAEQLAEMLTERGLRAAALTGALSKKKRTATLEQARAGDLDVIVGTQLLDEGIDLPSLSVLHMAWPARAAGRIIQRVGRALRVVDGKPNPKILDYVDAEGILGWQAKQRAAIFDRAFRTEAA